MKGFSELAQALEGFDYSEKEKPDYCLYYDNSGKIYKASTEEKEGLSYIKVPCNWPDSNNITDWVVIDGKLKQIEKEYYTILKKYNKIKTKTELNLKLPVVITEKDFRIIKKTVIAKQVKFNKKDESYFQFNTGETHT